MKNRIKVMLLCIPLFPIQLIGEWYRINTGLTSKEFKVWEETKEYWKTAYRYLKTK